MGKNFKLDIKPTYDFILYAFITDKDECCISWEINKALNIDLKKDKDIIYTDTKLNIEKSFSNFSYKNEINQTIYNLINNKSETGVLLKEYSKFNYILKIESGDEHFNIQDVINKIKDINGVLIITSIPLDPTSKKKNSIFEVFTDL